MTGAAYAAAAQARATQSTQGLIQSAARPASAPELAAGVRPPLVDTARLRLSESLAAPPVEKN